MVYIYKILTYLWNCILKYLKKNILFSDFHSHPKKEDTFLKIRYI